MPKQYKNTIINFEPNVPVSLILDTDPSRAKSKQMTGSYGAYVSYMYACKGDKLFFASEVLHSKLTHLKKGDEVVIEKTQQDGKTLWSVNGDTSAPVRSGNNSPSVSDAALAKFMFELKKIGTDLELLKKHVYGNNEQKVKEFEEEEPAEADDTGLGW